MEERGREMQGRKRATIGMMVSGIMDDFTRPACKGAMKIARELDVNLIVIPGKYIDRDVSDNPDLAYEYQYSSGFSFAKPENLDAVIIAAGSIGCFASREKIREMIEQFQGIPCVLISYQLEGYPYVQYDNASGIREGMDYLVGKMGCRHIGMLGGSLDNTDAQERKDAYMAALEEHGIPFEEKAYAEGNFTRSCSEAIKRLLDDNPELDAVFCVNDDTAIGLYEELNHRQKIIGRDVKLFGFDDVIQAARMNPPLASIRADSTELGEEALRMAASLAAGEVVESRILPARFIRRESAGKQLFEEKSEEFSGLKTVEEYFNDSFYRHRNEMENFHMIQIWDAFKRLAEKLFCVVENDSFQITEVSEIFEALTQFLDADGIAYAELSILLACFEEVYRIQKKELSGIEDRYELQKLYFNIYRKILQMTDIELGKISEDKEKENYAMKMFIRDALSFEKGNDLSYASMISNLEWLGIKNACIYTFAEPMTHLSGEYFRAPEELYLKAVLRNGNVETIPAIAQKTPLSSLFQRSLQGTEGESTFMCAPLFSNEIIYGLVFCNLTEQVFLNGEFLINQMSSAAKMITLLKANEKIQQELEESLHTLKENNIVLDNLSKSDGLTGIWNRRGFQIEGEKMIEAARAKEKCVLAIYVDMNNLKIINDRYGHEEGDFSIRLISTILSEAIKDRGIVGRIGGDEFACLMITEEEDDGRKLIEDIYRDFHSFNRESSKPYNITVSAGAVNLPAEQAVSLQEMLTQAEEKLYEVKKYRKKDVVKREYRK